MTRCAAIDLGTNTARLLIADRGTQGFEPLVIERRIIRLGGGFTHERGIAPDAWERGVSTMKEFAQLCDEAGVESIRAVATSAVRDARNGEAFREAVVRESGILLEIIQGDEEAVLTLRGVESTISSSAQFQFVFDVGGGSTEFILARHFSPLLVESLPLGVVRLTEGCLGDTVAMRSKIRANLALCRGELERKNLAPMLSRSILVGTAGTATTIAAIDLKLEQYDYRLVNGHVVTREFIDDLYERLVVMTPSERLCVTGLEKGREDLIIAGLMLTLETMECFGFHRMTVSDFGLLEGVLLSIQIT